MRRCAHSSFILHDQLFWQCVLHSCSSKNVLTLRPPNPVFFSNTVKTKPWSLVIHKIQVSSYHQGSKQKQRTNESFDMLHQIRLSRLKQFADRAAHIYKLLNQFIRPHKSPGAMGINFILLVVILKATVALTCIS